MGTQDSLTSFVQNVQLVRLRGKDPAAQDGQGEGHGLVARIKRRLGLWLFVIAPTVLTALYMFLLAAPRFELQAEFVVRLPGSGQASQIANMVSGTSVIRSVDDGYVVAAYVVSRDALKAVAAKDGFRDMLKKTGWDVIWRYPPFFMGDTKERLYRYFKSLVTVDYDQTTGIITLKGQAFTAADAQRLVAALLKHAEELINTMNDRATRDAVRVAAEQVETAKNQAYAAADKMTEFRDRERVIDPMLVSNSVLKNMAQLALLTAQANAQLLQMQKSSPENPQIASLKVRIASYNQQIANERAQLAGPNGTLAPQIAQYDKLLLAQQFAEKMFASSLTSLETARAEALRQRAFLEDITQPDRPDRADYPNRLLTIFSVFIVLWMIYRVASIFLADTLEHATR